MFRGPTSSARSFTLHVALILLVALALRIAAWWLLPYHGFISDEAEYLAASTWLAQGRGFSFFQKWIWTRPPLYIMFLAAHIKLFGPETLWPIRLSQALLSTLSVGLTMWLGALLAPRGRERKVGLTSGWAMAITYSFATFAFLLLSETLFITLLLAAFVALTLWAQAGRMRWLIIGGALLGLAALTRAILAGVLPLIALWVFWIGNREQGTGSGRRQTRFRRGIGMTAMLTIVVSAVILPWSVYNSRVYHADGLILIDTTGAYNLMLGAQAAHLEVHPEERCGPVATRCEQKIAQQLYGITFPDGTANHVERQRVATRTAMAWIAENPGGFVRKAGRELLDLLLINYGGAERLYNNYTLGAVPAPHLLGLLLDDTLYVLAAPLAVLGLFRQQCRAGKGLIVAWLLFNLITGPLTFAINRFRQPLLPFLFVYAACGVWQFRAAWPGAARRLIGLGLAGGLALMLLASYAYWPIARAPNGEEQGGGVVYETWRGFRGLADAGRCAEIERLINQGDLDAAQRLHDAEDRRRRADGPNPARFNCLALLNAQMMAQRGQTDQALALLQSMDAIPERYLLEGDIFRAAGAIEQARGGKNGPFVSDKLEPENPLEWAWDHLHPPATTEIDLGNGLDWGYIEGFYQREGRVDQPDNYRWMGPRGRLRFVQAGTGQPQTLHLRVDGWRPTTDPPARLTVGMAGKPIKTFDVAPEWQTLTVDLPPTPGGQDVSVDLASTVFVPGPEELRERQQVRQQLRLLGVQLDQAELTGAAGAD